MGVGAFPALFAIAALIVAAKLSVLDAWCPVRRHGSGVRSAIGHNVRPLVDSNARFEPDAWMLLCNVCVCGVRMCVHILPPSIPHLCQRERARWGSKN